MAKERIIIGLMSGTSVDAIDAAVVRVRGTSPQLTQKTLHLETYRWPAALRARLLAVMAPAETTTQRVCQLNAEVAYHFAQAALRALAAAGLPAAKIAAIASHGQTICHLPSPVGRPLNAQQPSTLQIGDPSIIATLTGIPTIGNFRAADMALGGQGAPLVPWTDEVLLRHATKARCIQNIGGIANVTYLPPHPPELQKPRRNSKRTAGFAPDLHPDIIPHPIRAFDTGPGNMLIDATVSIGTNGKKAFDRDGKMAARGKVSDRLFRALQIHPYFDRPPPKSTGREDFGLQLARQFFRPGIDLSLEDKIATLTYLTAWSIADAYFNYLPGPPDEVIVCGGGAENPTLMRMLGEQLHAISPEKPIRLARIDDFGIPNKAKEALSFALLGAATLDHVPANIPSVTGASRPAVLGVVAYP
jgi:anhydro-N-acetylmuramic acid kinase